MNGYCTDCENETVIHNGRCSCGSGRVIVGGKHIPPGRAAEKEKAQ